MNNMEQPTKREILRSLSEEQKVYLLDLQESRYSRMDIISILSFWKVVEVKMFGGLSITPLGLEVIDGILQEIAENTRRIALQNFSFFIFAEDVFLNNLLEEELND